MVVEVDVGGDTGSEFIDGGEGVPVKVFVLEDGPEALCAGVVVAPAGGSHGADQIDVIAESNDLAVAELAAPVGVDTVLPRTRPNRVVTDWSRASRTNSVRM